MKTAVQDYIEKYITTPDIDIMSDTNREFIYQEGGYSRFFPVLPGGYQPIQAPQGTPPEQGQHALWSSVAQNLQGAARIQQGNRQLKMQETQNKIDNELGYARLELAKQQLSQQDAQFKITTAFEQMRMSNTLHDRITNVELPSYRQKEYEDYIGSPDGIAVNMKAYEDAVAADDFNAQMRAANRINAAMSNPNMIKWSMEKKRDDETLKDLEILAKADPLSLQYKNISEVASAVVSGQQPPPVDWVGKDFYEKQASEQLYNEAKAQERELSIRTREATIALTEAKADLAEIDSMVTAMDLQEARLEFDELNKALAGISDPVARLDIIREYKAKVIASKSGGAYQPQNMTQFLDKYKNDPKMLDLYARFITLDNTNSMKVHNSNAPVGPTNLPVTNVLSKAIINATGGELGKYKALGSEEYAELARAIPRDNWFTPGKAVIGADGSTTNYVPATKSGADDSAVKMLENDVYEPSHVKINANDGSYSFRGVYKTEDYDNAKLLGYTGKESDESGYQYVIPNVITTTPSSLTGEDLRGYAPNTRTLNQSGSTTQQSTTQGQPPHAAGPNQAWEYINGKWILINIPPK